MGRTDGRIALLQNIYIFIRINCSFKDKKLKKRKEKDTHNVSKNSMYRMHANYAQLKRQIT